MKSRLQLFSLEENMAQALAKAATLFDKLLVAAYYGNIKLAKELISSGAPVNPAPDTGKTPLYIAAAHDQLEMVKFLIAEGADVNQSSPSHLSFPLQGAITSRNLDIFNVLLEHDVDVHRINSFTQENMLHAAVHLSEYRFEMAVTMINKLLARGVDLNLKDGFGSTPLDVAQVINIHTWTILEDETAATREFSILQSLLTPGNSVECEGEKFSIGKTLVKIGQFAKKDALNNAIPPLPDSLFNGFVGFKK